MRRYRLESIEANALKNGASSFIRVAPLWAEYVHVNTM